eukprot:5618873-Amphidinium_carterae.2
MSEPSSAMSLGFCLCAATACEHVACEVRLSELKLMPCSVRLTPLPVVALSYPFRGQVRLIIFVPRADTIHKMPRTTWERNA